MYYRSTVHFFCALLLITAGCRSSSSSGKGALSELSVQEVAESNNALAWGLYEQLQQRPGNILVSPYSLTAVMAMVYAGARGETAEQIQAVFRFPLDHKDLFAGLAKWIGMFRSANSSTYTFNTANAAWVQEGLALDPKYEAFMQQFSDALQRVDFAKTSQAGEKINQWVSQTSKGKIQDLIAPGVLKSSTQLTLVNAVYLSANWTKPFEAKNTRTEPFFVTPDNSVTTPMMHQRGRFPVYSGPTFNAIELSYDVGGHDDIELAMRIYLPNQSDGLNDLESFLQTQGGTADLPQVWEERTVVLTLPKFRIVAMLELAPVLKAMGMPIAFKAEKADFSGIANSRDLVIDEIIQKAVIDVDEKGTEAAAATAAVVMRALSLSQDESTLEFLADHPFVFTLVDRKSGTILFMGRLTEP